MANANTVTALNETQLAMLRKDILVSFEENASITNYALTNSDLGAEVQPGVTIPMPVIPTFTIGNYSKGTDISLAGKTVTAINLAMEYSKTFHFTIDDTEKWCREILETGLMAQAASDLSDQMESDVLSKYADVHADCQLDATDFASQGVSSGDAIVPSAAENSDYYVGKILAKVGRVFKENKTPRKNRVIYVPPFFVEKLIQANMVKLDAPEVVKAQATIDGFVGRLYGLDIVETNNLTVDTDTFAVAWQKYALAIGQGLAQFESTRIPLQFGTLFKGLLVYGAEFYKTKQAVVLRLNETA